jgi:hypothetical protein
MDQTELLVVLFFFKGPVPITLKEEWTCRENQSRSNAVETVWHGASTRISGDTSKENKVFSLGVHGIA